MAELVSGLSKLNPFSKKSSAEDDDYGEAIDTSTVAGGGHGARQSTITKSELRVSNAIKSFLVDQGVVPVEEAGLESDEITPSLRSFLDKPHINVPLEVTDRSHPLPDYFISSSHNTYLMAHQLFGESNASAYEIALRTGSRCVEIDAWDNDDDKEEPKVTHGYTLVSHIPFRAVCETIRDVVDREANESSNQQGYRAAPIMISLENHCGSHGQLRLSQIMREVWGGRLLSKAVRDKGTREQEGDAEHITLAELGSKIVVIVEYHLSNEKADDPSSASESEDEEARKAHQEYRNKKKSVNTGAIIPELAELGVYAQSVKPANNSWYESALENGPHHHLINVSEVGLKSHLPAATEKIARHNSQHLMRVFPKGTRISSQNLKPVPFWGVGAQICALNWQTFGASSQVNEALFSGTDGYVLKPQALRQGGSGQIDKGIKKRLRVHVAGATDVPLHAGHKEDEIKPYVTCTLVHPSDLNGNPPKRKTSAYKQHKLGIVHRGQTGPPTDPFWDETLEWEYEDNDLTFLRVLLKSDDAFATNPTIAVACVRLLYTTKGWNFIRLLDLKGRETKCSLLVKFEIDNL